MSNTTQKTIEILLQLKENINTSGVKELERSLKNVEVSQKKAEVSTKKTVVSQRKLGKEYQKTSKQADKTYKSTKKIDVSQKKAVKSTKTLSQKIKELSKRYHKLTSDQKKASAGFSKFSSVTGSIIKFTGAIAAISFPIAAFAKFDAKMKRVAALSGATEEQFKALSDAAQELGRTTSLTATQAAEGLELLAMAGLSVNEQITALPSVFRLAKAGAVDFATAADISTNIMTGYGFAVEKLAYVNDRLVQTFTSSNSTLQDLGSALVYVGPIAAGLGANFEDLLATLGGLHNAGLKATLAGTSLRGVLNALFNPTAAEAELMQDLSRRIGGVGLQIKDTEGDFVGFASIIKQLEKAGVKAEEALKLFGLRAGPGMAALLKQGSGQIEKMTKELNNSDGVAKRIAKKMGENLPSALKKLKSAINALSITMGSKLAPAAEYIVRSFTKLINSVNELSKRFPGLTKAITYFLGILGGLIATTAALGLFRAALNNIVAQSVISGFGSLVTAFKSLNVAFTASAASSGLLYVALTSLVAIAGVLVAINLAQVFMEWMEANKKAQQAMDNLVVMTDNVINRFLDFQNIKFPADPTKLTRQDLEKLNKDLTKSRAFWTAFANQMRATGNDQGLKEANETLKKIKEQLGTVKQAAESAAEGLKKPVDGIMASSKALDQFESNVRKAYGNAIKEAEKYRQKVVAIEEELYLKQLSTKDKLRELSRKLLTEEEQIDDKKLQAQEKLQAAKDHLAKAQAASTEEIAKQEYELVKKLTQEAESLFENTAGNTEDSVTNAMQGVQESANVAMDALKAQAADNKTKWQEAENQAKDLGKTLDEIAKDREAKFIITEEGLKKIESALDALEKRKRYVHIYEKYHKASKIDDGKTKLDKAQDVEPPPQLPSGFSSGGRLPGYSRNDSVPAWLSPGEDVTNSLSTRIMDKVFPGLLSSINRITSMSQAKNILSKYSNIPFQMPSQIVQKFASGGRVQDMGKVQLNLSVGGNSLGLDVLGHSSDVMNNILQFEKQLKRQGLANA